MSPQDHNCPRHRRYVMTCSEWETLLRGTGPACACCQQRPHEVVDHDHRYGPAGVRGLVCPQCNRDLAYVDASLAQPSAQIAAYLLTAWHLTNRPALRFYELPTGAPIADAEAPVGTYEVASLLNVNRQRVHQLASTQDFPRPIARLRAGTLWAKGDVIAWARSKGRIVDDVNEECRR